MSFPLVLLQPKARNESQDTQLTTIKLTPNAHSNFQTRFAIPVQGHILDSNSALVWRVEWAGYDDTAEDYEKVVLKQYSGALNTIRRARFYIGGREIFVCEDVGHLVHIKRLAKNPDYVEEVLDKTIGSQHGHFVSTDGKFQMGQDGEPSVDDRRYTRQLGSGTKGIECSLLLSDIFSALESLQLPMKLDQMRIELDWETDFDECATVLRQGDGTGGKNVAITVARKVINITNPVLLLDYLTFNEDLQAGLEATLRDGMVLPYVHTSVVEKVIGENTDATNDTTTDIQIALQGKLLMKMYASHRFSDVIAGDFGAYQKLQGRCRSQRGKDFKYNLYINDLAIHDQPVDLESMAYSFLEMTHQAPVSIMAGLYKYPDTYGVASANTDIISGTMKVAGSTTGVAVANTTPISVDVVKDGLTGTQSYIGFDLSKYDEGSKVVPSNAGYRCGSAPVILRVIQKGGGVDSIERLPKKVQIFTEEVMVLQVRGGVVDILQA
jgi:hypothetical protein